MPPHLLSAGGVGLGGVWGLSPEGHTGLRLEWAGGTPTFASPFLPKEKS